ncbi:hypothetical protein [Caenimonas sp. SL110]|uniref:hypothetical protein n=1 Tax=Caenimonas sp. SL110 TaxID=1450524 RepID=UPI00065450CD|nr:hypothetical protein [Caenimonas sp. SL110]
MDAQFDSHGKPVPPLFQKAVTDFARQTGLDAEPLFKGTALEHEGAHFWLRHFGDADATGLTIQMDIGEAPPDAQSLVAMTYPLLQSHLSMPPGIFGYYGYLPELNRLVHCTRISLDEVDDGAAAIVQAVQVRALQLAGARSEAAKHTTTRALAS